MDLETYDRAIAIPMADQTKIYTDLHMTTNPKTVRDPQSYVKQATPPAPSGTYGTAKWQCAGNAAADSADRAGCSASAGDSTSWWEQAACGETLTRENTAGRSRLGRLFVGRKFLRIVPLIFLYGCSVAQDISDERKAEEALKARMVDPDSAKFRNLHIATVTTEEGSLIRSVCGEVNMKNGFGGYIGYQPFEYVALRKRPQSKAGTWDMWKEGSFATASPNEKGTLNDISERCENGRILKEDTIDGVSSNLVN